VLTATTTFEALYSRYAAELRQVARAVVRDPVLAEDVVQDVFERLWRGSGYDERRGPLGPYLRMLVRSRALDVWRRGRAGERMQTRLEEVAGGGAVAPHDPEAAFMLATERTVARAAVRRLPDEQRQAIGLAYWGGLSVQEVATTQGIPLGTAKSRVRLGLDKLARDQSLAAA
jgi:RNA polymerase sigma-70 factor (ECF subfamily)